MPPVAAGVPRYNGQWAFVAAIPCANSENLLRCSTSKRLRAKSDRPRGPALHSSATPPALQKTARSPPGSLWRRRPCPTGPPAGPGIVLGSGSDPSVIFEAGIRIPAVFGAAGIKLVVSRRIRAELRSAGLKCCVVAPLITTNLTKTPSWFRKVESCHAPHVVNFSSGVKYFCARPRKIQHLYNRHNSKPQVQNFCLRPFKSLVPSKCTSR